MTQWVHALLLLIGRVMIEGIYSSKGCVILVAENEAIANTTSPQGIGNCFVRLVVQWIRTSSTSSYVTWVKMS